jgi:replication fork clamp-binding protein CrfC|tara:strand:+ start:232 stop:462 length:231 start_codon:yes stop_codon:yes gene_type:complete
MTKRLVRVWKGKLGDVSDQIRAEAEEERKEQELYEMNPNFVKMGDAVVSHSELLDRMVKMGNITQSRAEELKKEYS